MSPDPRLTALLVHFASLFEVHDRAIARTAVAALRAAEIAPITKPPQRIAQCEELEAMLAIPGSPTMSLLARAYSVLHWADSGGADRPAAVQRRLAFVELIGPTGMCLNSYCRLGLFFQGQETAYPAHRHAAQELYLVLSGTALWRRESEKFTLVAPGSFIHHDSWEPHAMTTLTEPLVALWCWTGNIAYKHYEILS